MEENEKNETKDEGKRCGGRGNYAKIQNSCEFQVKNLLFQSMKSNLLVSRHESNSLFFCLCGGAVMIAFGVDRKPPPPPLALHC